MLTARKLLQTKNHDVEMCLRGVLRGFGLKVGRTTPLTFPGRIRELVADHGGDDAIAVLVDACDFDGIGIEQASLKIALIRLERCPPHMSAANLTSSPWRGMSRPHHHIRTGGTGPARHRPIG